MKNSIKKLPMLLLVGAMLGGCNSTSDNEKDSSGSESGDVTPTTYNVKFMNGDTTFKEQSVEEGKTVEKPSTNPTKAEDSDPQSDGKYYSYTFDKWMEGDSVYNFESPVTKDTVLDAAFTKEVVMQTVTFKNGEQTVYSTEVEKGSVATFSGTEPTKAADETNKSYTFAGWKNGETVWNLDSDKVMSDVTLSAYFTPVARESYIISLVDEDGSTPLGQVNAKEGLAAAKPSDPSKTSDAQYSYEFDKWLLDDAEYDWASPVNGNITLKASWKKTLQKYDVKFMNGENVVESKEDVEYGTSIIAPEDDLTYSEGGYKYKHLGWAVKDSTEVIENFGTVTGDATFYAVFDEPELITYTATVKFEYEGGGQDQEIEYNVENRAEKLAAISALLPAADEDNIYEWKEALPEALPFEDCEFSVVANCKYFAVDMSESDINSNIALVNRSGSASLAVENDELKFVSSNDVFFLKRSYTNFDLEFNLKSNSDVFSFVLGAKDGNMNANYGEGAPGNAANGTAFIVVKLTHASSRVRPYGNGAQIESCPNNTAIETPSLTDGVKVKLHCEGNYFEIYINDTLEVAREFAANAYTPGGYVGIFAPSATMRFSSLGISKVVPTDEFTTDFSSNVMPKGLVFNGRSGETYSINDGVLTTSAMQNGNMYTEASLAEMTVEFEIKLNGRFAVEIGAKEMNKGYADGVSSIDDKYVGFYFMNNTIFFVDNDVVRNGKDGANIKSFGTKVAFDGTSFVKVKIDFHNNKFNISLNDTAVITDVSPTNGVTAGHFAISRASTGVAMSFDSFSLKY